MTRFQNQRRALLGGAGSGIVVPVVKTNGAVSSSSGKTIVTFYSDGFFSTSSSITVRSLVVGGGGGGAGGGGGGGAAQENAALVLSAGVYQIRIGIGGVGVIENAIGNNGSFSSFAGIVANGGGGGGKQDTATAPSGGTGGGGAGSGSVTTSGGTGSQGYAGGGNAGFKTSPYPAGGGGGAGGVGLSASSSSVAGGGGIGYLSNISGTSTYYGGGGGGGLYANTGTPGTGGIGGGGGGSNALNTNGISGSANTGGGGGGTANSATAVGGNGANGIVIISFTPTVTSSPGLLLAQIATRTYLPNQAQASTTGWNSVTAHYARDNITGLSVADANWYVNPGVGEVNQGGTQTVTRSIEYPSGTFTQVKWNGSASVVIADGNTAWSDIISITIPNGALFLLHKYQVNSANVLNVTTTNAIFNTSLGEGSNNSNADQTMGGFVNDVSKTQFIPTTGIIGLTTKPSIAALGSSRMSGSGNTTRATDADIGYSKMFGPSFAYMNYGVGSDSTVALAASMKNRISLAKYCTHLWLDPGLNDLNGSKTAAQVMTALTSIAAQWPTLSKVMLNTEGPWTTSTDGWVTSTNQTVASFEAQRVALNSSIVALTGYNQVIRAESFDGNGTNSQYWNNPAVGGSQFTTDGIHENTAADNAMAIAGIFNPALVTNP